MPAARLEKTKTPGVYRRGKVYVVRYRHRGQERKKFARTYAEARNLKATLTADMRRGEYREHGNVSFETYAKEWIETYQGRTTRGFRESTRRGYRFSIEERVIPFFSKRVGLLAEVEPKDVRAFITWLFEGAGSERKPAVGTVRCHVAALKVMLATAVEDGLIRHNPASSVRISRPGEPQDVSVERRALDGDELQRFLEAVEPGERLLFELLAMTGVRVGEAVELRWKDVDFGAKRLRVRRQFYEGVVSEPKSKNGKRDIPLSTSMAQQLWRHRGGQEELLFTNARGLRIDSTWARKNVLAPAGKKAGVPWAGFHTFRHTCASMLFARGKNPKVVQMWLGHADPGFTLRTYVHLIDDGLGDADFLDESKWATPRATRATSTEAKDDGPTYLEVAS